jgi:hypothetical protein
MLWQARPGFIAGGPAPYSPAPAAYVGPGDLFSGALVWGSPARAYSAAFAATAGAIVDLVDQAGANPITINVLTTGFVDNTAITNWVSANSVSTIRVPKLYDQTGNGRHFTTGTLSQMPTLTLNALGGLPGMTGSTGGSTRLPTGNITQAQPLTMSTVYVRTSGTSGEIAGAGTGSTVSMNTGGANVVNINAGTVLTGPAAADSSFHSLQGVFNGASSAVNVDGSETTGNAGSNSLSAVPFRLFVTNGGNFLNGSIMEAGLWPSAANSTNRGDLSTNQHSSAYGYNF